MPSYDKWGRLLTSSTGGTSYDKWGRPVHHTAAVTGADLQHIVDNATHGSSFLHSAEHLGTDFLAGIYGTGRAAVIDVKNNPESLATGPAAPFTANLISILRGHGGGHLTKDIAIPTGYAYKNKYYSRDVLHNIKEDPFGTLLDAAALGTIPIGAEGLEIRAGTLAARLGDSEAGFARALAKAGGPDTKLGKAVIRKAASAAKKQEPYDIHYAPEGAVGETFKASRARTVQGRYLYNPLRDALGRAGGGQLKWFGDASRLAKFQAAERDLNLAGDYQAGHDFNTAIGANLRPSKRLRKEEQVALPLLAEYGPTTAQQAELGAPRLQRVEFYHEKIAETEQALAKIEGKSRRDKQRRTLRSILKAQKRMLGILTDTKLAPKIDAAIKTPRPVLQEVLGAADTLAEEQGKILVEAGHATPEILEARRHTPQYVLHGYTLGPADEEGVREWVHPGATAATAADEITLYHRSGSIHARQLVERGLDPATANEGRGVVWASTSPDEELYGPHIVAFKINRNDPRIVEVRPGSPGHSQYLLSGKIRPEEIISGRDTRAGASYRYTAGPKSLEQIRAEHPDARYYPHMGPKLNAEGGRVRFGLTPKTPNIAMRNEGVRLSTGHLDLGPRAYSRAFAQALSLKATNLALEQLKPLMIPAVDGRAGKGYALVNPHKVSLSRFEREQGDVRDQFENLTDQEHAERMQQELDQLFPQAAHTAEEKKQLMQVPEEFVKRIRKDYTSAHWVTRKFIDFPLTVWKALVLKYRPAWLVNNILGQHLLLLLHHPFGWSDYVAALTPRKRKELSRGIYNLGGTGTVELVRDRTFKDAGFESSLRGRIKSGEKGGIAGKALYRLPSWPYRIVKGFGDGMAKANLSIADNQTRLTLGRHYVKDYRDRTRLKEIISGFDDANAALKASAVKGKSLEQIAAEMPVHEKIELLRKVNSALGNFNTLHGTQGKWLRRAVPFAAWFKVILEISRDLLIEHPEKVWLIHNLEVAARKNPEVMPQFDVPSWFVGSLVAPWFGAGPGEDALISTNTANPFATPQQLLDQISVLTRSGTPSGQQSPSSALGPGMEAWNLLQGFDPFYGGEYTGPGDKSPGYQRVALGIAAGLPPVRLANEAGVPLTGKYHEPQSYRDRFINIGGRDFPLDALLRYLGLPLRRANRAKLEEYANRGL